MCHRHIPSSKRNPPLKIFARSSETYFAASYQTSTSLDEFRNFSEYSEIYSLPFPPIPTVANMPEIAAVRVQINLDCCKYCPKCCRRGLRSCFELFEMFFEVKNLQTNNSKQLLRVCVTNVRGKIKLQILVTCKICNLPFFPCRHTLFL